MSKSAVVFGITRGGSSVTARLLHILAGGAKWGIRDIGGEAYANGVPFNEIGTDIFADVPTSDVLVGPFREVPPHAAPILTDAFRKVIVFRDPRDALVSHYFAFKNIHSVFVKGQKAADAQRGRQIRETIDEYVVTQSQAIKKAFTQYIDLMKTTEEIRSYKYEDIALDPMAWLADVSVFLEMSADADSLNTAVIEAAFWRVSADAFAHNRQGMSGDFLKHLQPETIEKLNEIFADVLDFLDYPLEPRSLLESFENTDLLKQAVISQRLQMDEMKRTILKLLRANGAVNAELKALSARINALTPQS